MTPLIHGPQGPFSSEYKDIFFSKDNGLEESRYVFLGGNGLPGRWFEKQTFRVGEIGFGSGLNILALGDLWRSSPWKPKLEVYSLEKHPWSPEDLKKVHDIWPCLAEDSEILIGTYNPLAEIWTGFFPWGTLRVYHGDALQVIMDFPEEIDAWFLDGFAPDRTPELWSPELMNWVYGKTAPGGTAATFTAAGVVKQALRQAGFFVKRSAGFGTKRHMVKALKLG